MQLAEDEHVCSLFNGRMVCDPLFQLACLEAQRLSDRREQNYLEY